MNLLLLFACTGTEPCADGYGRLGDGSCVALDDGADPLDDPTDTSDLDSAPPTDTDTGAASSGLPAWGFGDPLVPIGDLDMYDDFVEAVEAVIFHDDYGLVSGQGGWVVVDLQTGAQLHYENTDRIYYMAHDPSTERVWLGTRYGDVRCIDVSDPDDVVDRGDCQIQALDANVHDDVAAADGLVMLAGQEQGAFVYDGDGEQLGLFAADNATSVAMHGGRALVADGASLVLIDLSDPESPSELDRLELAATGRDIAFDGDRAVVAMTADGVAVVDLEDDVLVDRGSYEVGGTANRVALDGDYAYSASWTQFEVAWVGDEGPEIVGHEAAIQYAFGVAAQNGRVLGADWFHAQTLEHDRTVAGPELDLPVELLFTEPDSSVALTVKNAGPMELEVSLAPDNSAYTVTPDALTIAPGGASAVVVTAEGEPAGGVLNIESNDPDESSVELEMRWGTYILGEQPDNFTLEGFEYPDNKLSNYSLHDYRGKPLFIAFWAEY